MMKKENIMIGIIGLLVGVIATGIVAVQAVNNDNTGMMQMMGIDTKSSRQHFPASHSAMSMADMNEQLESLSGDDFDRAFIEMMIAHHEGAVDMAGLSSSRAKHDEIKELSEAIISAQEKEIVQMKQWQTEWGYDTSEADQMMHEGH